MNPGPFRAEEAVPGLGHRPGARVASFGEASGAMVATFPEHKTSKLAKWLRSGKPPG
jgi:hypothetical protein